MKKTPHLNKADILSSCIVVLAAGSLSAQMSITALNTEVIVDFDSSLSGVNNGTFAAGGIVASPSAGQLDSDAWRVTGLSAGDTTFGGDFTGASFTRGTSTGGVTAQGMWAFDTAGTGGNWTLGIQPGGNDFTPGSITLRVQNNTGGTVSQWDLAYDLFIFNDQNRSNSWNWAWSTDDISYTTIDTFSSAQGGDGSPSWNMATDPEALGVNASVTDGGFLYLQWFGDYVAGSGGRDEFAIDNISVTAVPEPAAGALLFGLAGLILISCRRR